VASTGVIGVRMPIDAALAGIESAACALVTPSAESAAEAIMTTDTFAKQAAVTFAAGGRTYTVGGMAKGSGMIQPNMATMLAFLTTDAPLTSEGCDAALRSAVATTFNRITVDSDTSTNDMCLLMASGAAGGEPIGPGSAAFADVAAAVRHVCTELARMIARDGEGATKLIDVVVRGAASEADAEAAAFSIANSPLFKTAVFGGDANWGRVAMAVGKSAAEVDPDRLEIVFAGVTTCVDGTGLEFDEDAATAALARDHVEVLVDLHLGQAEATVWTCDLTYEYVRINGDYRS
jgi:glutamate N-acetyltransferase/amino-acid N-acetyltransferase